MGGAKEKGNTFRNLHWFCWKADQARRKQFKLLSYMRSGDSCDGTVSLWSSDNSYNRNNNNKNNNKKIIDLLMIIIMGKMR